MRVVAVAPDKDVDVVADLGKTEYELSVIRDGVPVYVAYYEPIDVPDVGHSFTAYLDSKDGTVHVAVPDRGWVRYEVVAARQLR